MKKTTKSRQSTAPRPPKFLIGAIAGAVVVTLAVLAAPAIAPYILVTLVVIAAYVFITTRQTGAAKQWSPRKLSAAPVMGALVIGVTAIAGVQFLGMSLAWHPEGVIKKTVRNVTQNGEHKDANNDASAVMVHPGDILEYTVEVKNVAPDANNQYNDMAYTEMTDQLPAGVELVSNPSQRTVTADMGTILPGESASRTFQVKVTSTTNGAKIKNRGCFEADSVVRDNPQDGCDDAVIKVQVPSSPPPNPPNPNPPSPNPPNPNPPSPNPPSPNPPSPNPPSPNPPSPNPPSPNPPSPNPPSPNPPSPNPPTPTPPTPTPPTPPPTDPSPVSLPNVGARSIIVVILSAIVAGYIFSALYGSKNRDKAIRFKVK